MVCDWLIVVRDGGGENWQVQVESCTVTRLESWNIFRLAALFARFRAAGELDWCALVCWNLWSSRRRGPSLRCGLCVWVPWG